MSEKLKTPEELIRAGAVAVPKLPEGTRLIAESYCGSLYEIKLLSRASGLVEFFSIHPAIRSTPPKEGIFLGSWSDMKGTVQIADWIVRNCRILVKLGEVTFITEPIIAVSVYGDGWTYEVFA